VLIWDFNSFRRGQIDIESRQRNGRFSELIRDSRGIPGCSASKKIIAITSSFPQLPVLFILSEFGELIEVVDRPNRIGRVIARYPPHHFGRGFSDLHCYVDADCIVEATENLSE
jgi:hypothetical protein